MTVKNVFTTNAELDYPTVLPTLDLDFANTKTLDPRITFTRASGGSYVGPVSLIKYAGVNEARFDHDPETGESLGLLIEEARTNLVTDSITLNNFPDKTNVTVQDNAIISPDGTQNAGKIIETNDTGFHALSRINVSTLQNTTYTISGYFKKAERKIVTISFRNNTFWGTPFGPSATFDIETGNLLFTSGVIISTDVLSVGNGWYRCSATATRDSSGTIISGISIDIHRDKNQNNYQGIEGTGIYAWGLQFEAGSFASSFIPTQGSTRTRGRDIAKITGKNVTDFYNYTESTILVKFIIRGMFSTGAFNVVLELSQSGSSKLTTPLTLGTNSTNLYDEFIIDNVQYFQFNNIPHSYGEKSSYVIGLKENDSYRIAKISDRQEDILINTTVPLLKFFPNTLNIGSQFSTDSRQINGTISKITYYPKRLPNSQLQALVS